MSVVQKSGKVCNRQDSGIQLRSFPVPGDSWVKSARSLQPLHRGESPQIGGGGERTLSWWYSGGFASES
jgi:hypothetical protein